MEIKYEMSYRGYETRNPSLMLAVYAGDEGIMYSDDKHSMFSQLWHGIPEFEFSEDGLVAVERRIQNRYRNTDRACKYTPKNPMSRRDVIALFKNPKRLAKLRKQIPADFIKQYSSDLD